MTNYDESYMETLRLETLQSENFKNTATIARLTTILRTYHVPHKVHRLYDGAQITFPWTSGDVVCHRGSYGHNLGHVESMGFSWDDGDVSEYSVPTMGKRIVREYIDVLAGGK